MSLFLINNQLVPKSIFAVTYPLYLLLNLVLHNLHNNSPPIEKLSEEEDLESEIMINVFLVRAIKIYI